MNLLVKEKKKRESFLIVQNNEKQQKTKTTKKINNNDREKKKKSSSGITFGRKKKETDMRLFTNKEKKQKKDTRVQQIKTKYGQMIYRKGVGTIPRHFGEKFVFEHFPKNNFVRVPEKLKNFPTPEIDQSSDREIPSDEYFLRKVNSWIEKSNPMNILREN